MRETRPDTAQGRGGRRGATHPKVPACSLCDVGDQVDIDFSNLKVLIADDDPFMRMIVVSVLESLGVAEVNICCDGASAFAETVRFSPDLLIIDHAMRPMTGMALAERIRRGPTGPFRRIPIIMVTAFADEEMEAKARSAGIDEFLGKPVTSEGLLAAVEGALDPRRSFIESPHYVGPDRRRKGSAYSGEDRRDRLRVIGE